MKYSASKGAAILNSDHLSQQKRWLSARLGSDALVLRYSTSAGRIETKFLRSYLELLQREKGL
jgi:hypothetical protein